ITPTKTKKIITTTTIASPEVDEKEFEERDDEEGEETSDDDEDTLDHSSVQKSYKVLEIERQMKQIERLEKVNIVIVGQLIDFLKSWKYVLKEVQKGNSPSLFMVLPCIGYLREDLIHREKSERGAMKLFAKRALSLMNIMFNMNDEYIMAAFLHPNYKQLRHATPAQITDCYETCRLFAPSNVTSQNEEVLEPLDKKQKIFLATLMDRKITKKKDKVKDEVQQYIEMKLTDDQQYLNPLSFWKEKQNQKFFPNLARLAKRYFSIPCSSAAVEREFSAAGQIVNQRRSSLDPSSQQHIIFTFDQK
ncbi:unnamed protein product, partial [Didymodactylos carnosus]